MLDNYKSMFLVIKSPFVYRIWTKLICKKAVFLRAQQYTQIIMISWAFSRILLKGDMYITRDKLLNIKDIKYTSCIKFKIDWRR